MGLERRKGAGVHFLYYTFLCVSFFNGKNVSLLTSENKGFKYIIMTEERKVLLGRPVFKMQSSESLWYRNYADQSKSPPKCKCSLDSKATVDRWHEGTQDLKAWACHIETQVQQH